jgi:hypothetical protein
MCFFVAMIITPSGAIATSSTKGSIGASGYVP